MPFSNAWSSVIPAGPTSAKLIDDHIRQLRLDIEERMEAALIVDWAGDPLVLKPELKGGQNGKQIVIHGSAFNFHGSGEVRTNYVYAKVDTGPLVCPVILPKGSDAGPLVIKLVEFMVHNVDCDSITCELRRRSFANGETADQNQIICSVTELAGVQKIAACPAISIGITLGDIQMYYLVIEALGSATETFRVFGARITYDAPDSRATY